MNTAPRTFFLMTLPVLLVFLGCSRYPEVSSPESLRLVTALRTACSTQKINRLDKVANAVEKARQDGKVTEQEYESFQRIVQTARAGDWKRAERECYRFQKDQVR